MKQSAGSPSGCCVAGRVFSGLVVAALLVLHQDTWNWARVKPLWFGMLPPGLAYHALYTLACSVAMALVVRFAWPREIEPADNLPTAAEPGPAPAERSGAETPR